MTRHYTPHRSDFDACARARVLVRAGTLTISPAEHYALDDVIAAYLAGDDVTQANICRAHDAIARMRDLKKELPDTLTRRYHG